jgi:hypothetical protein
MNLSKDMNALNDMTATWELDAESKFIMASQHGLVRQVLDEMFVCGFGDDISAIQDCQSELEKFIAGEFDIEPELSEKVFEVWLEQQDPWVKERCYGRYQA